METLINTKNGWEVHVGAVKASHTYIFIVQILGMVTWLQEASEHEKAEEVPSYFRGRLQHVGKGNSPHLGRPFPVLRYRGGKNELKGCNLLPKLPALAAE